jgi:hypothetical protein
MNLGNEALSRQLFRKGETPDIENARQFALVLARR